MGPTEPHSSALGFEQEALLVAFRRHWMTASMACNRRSRTRWLAGACLFAEKLTWSALHRCPQRHGISRLPDVEGDKPGRQKFKRYPIGFFHIDIAEVQTTEA